MYVALLATRPSLPSALCKTMVGLHPRELFWLWMFVGMLFSKDRELLCRGHLLGKRPELNSLHFYGIH